MKRIPILALLSLVIFYSCTPAAPTREDIIGVWVSDDGAEFLFNGDSTFTVTNIPESIINIYGINKNILLGSGIWRIKYAKSMNLWQIELSITKIDGLIGGWGEYLFVDKNPFAHSRLLSFFDDEFVEKNFYVSSNWLLSFFDEKNGKYFFKKVAQ